MVMMVKRFDGTMEWPRRNCMDQLIPAEAKLHEALAAVEALPADVRLTEVSTGIIALLDKLADWCEESGYVKPEGQK